MNADELGPRFATVVHPPDDSDWLEVRRLARKHDRRSRRRLPLVAAVIAAAVIVAPALALGGGKLFRLFESGEPASPQIERSFSRLDAGAPPGFQTGVEAMDARKVVLPNGVALWVAPTTRGGFCLFVQDGGGHCDTQRVLPFWPTLSIGGRFSPDGIVRDGPVLVDGSTTLTDAATVEIEFENGESVTVPVVWISAPIAAGVFGYSVPRSHWKVGARPIVVILRDESGKELRRDTSAFYFPSFRRGPSTGLVECTARTQDPERCLEATMGPGHQAPARARMRPPSDHFGNGLPWHG